MISPKLAEAGVSDPFELAQKKKKESLEKQKKREVANKRRQSTNKEVANPVTLNLSTQAKIPTTSLQKAITISQKSTASMGKFDKLHKDEPKI
jgi:hypothetical protein